MSVIEAGQSQLELLQGVLAFQARLIAEPDPRPAYAQALELCVNVSHSEYALLGEMRRKPDGAHYLWVCATWGNSDHEGFRSLSDRTAATGVELHDWDEVFRAMNRSREYFATRSNGKAAKKAGETLPGFPPFASLLALPIIDSAGDPIGMLAMVNGRDGHDHALVARLQPIRSALAVALAAQQRLRQCREADISLRESESRLRIFADQVTVGLFLQDAQARIVDVNQWACESLGYSREELIGMTLPDFDSAITPAEIEERIARLAAGESLVFESRHRRKDSVEFPVEVHVRPLSIDGKLHMLALVGDINDRKRSEEALRAAQRRLEFTLKGADVGLWDWDLTTNEVVFSDEWISQLGYAPDEVGNTIADWKTRVHPDDMAQAEEKVRDAIERRTTEYRAEFRMRHKDGTWRWILSRGAVIDDTQGKPVSMLGVHIDITDRKRVEQALRESESRYRTFVDHATDAFFLQDRQGRVLDVNEQACASLGYQREEIIGKFPFEFDPDVTPESVQTILQKLDAAEMIAFDSHHTRKDGTTFPVEVRLRPFWINDERYNVALVRDITERKRAEQALRESESRLRTLLENLDKVAVQAYEPDGTITFWNRASELFYGHSAEQALGRDLVELLLAEPAREKERQVMAEALRTGQPPGAEEVEVVRRDGSKMTVFASRIVHPRAGKQPEFFSFDVDISDRKRAEEELALRQAELLHASRLSTVGQMVAEISHEVAQPLNAIGNFAAASKRILETNSEEQRESLEDYVQAILDQNERCITILGRLRDFSRRAPATHANCDIRQLLYDSVDLVSLELRRNNIHVQIQLEEGLPAVLGDRIQLQQVVVNLLTNARDALEGQPEHRRKIFVRGYTDSNGIVLEVADSGCGLSGESTLRMFDPFYTTKRHGMGIGLSICQSIVKDHGGRIDPISNSQGGAIFRVRLPFIGKKSHD